MNYCNHCGKSVDLEIPEGDTRLRHICHSCDTIHYENPKIIVGTLPTWDNKVLLCRRAIEPRKGLWTLPAGFMENAETTEEGARRESYEEATIKLQELQLYTVISLPHISQVYMFYLGELESERYTAGIESLEVQLFSEAEIPWDELAFNVVETTLRHYFSDRKTEYFPTRNLVQQTKITPKINDSALK